MTTAQPGQEQRMDQPCQTPLVELLEGVPADARMTYEHHATHHQMIPVGRLCHEAAAAIRAARPTADLGEDGELIERLRYGKDVESWWALGAQAADRLILYREAVAKARPLVEAHFECVERTEALFVIDAVLAGR